ncbi:MAG: TonB family protein [Chitinivibrionales bacterium]|nr:TonB family protein [Chitinivibrionales bacterium]
MSAAMKIVSMVLIIVASVGFNMGLVDIRFEELRYLLDKIVVDEKAGQTFGIVAKYELIKQRILYGEENIKSFELEAKVAALTSSGQAEKLQENKQQKFYLIPIRIMLNGIRFVLGKEPIKPKEENQILKVLEIGYFWERNKKYPEAIKIYDQVMENPGLTPEIKSAVMAHKAFCHSMLSEYSVAKDIYERIINVYPETEAGILSWKLLDFIESMEEERTSVKAQKDLSDFEKAKQFYMLMDYRNAIRYFSIFFQKNPSSRLEWEARYFKGRAHEEMGETQEATTEYYRVMRNDKSRVWAKQANRRMIMLGEFYEHKQQMAEEARKQLAKYQDQAFMDRLEQFADLVEESSLRKELLGSKSQKEITAYAVDDSLLKLINKIGSLDLTGEKEKKKHRELEKMKRELMAKGSLPKGEIKELERLTALKGNPYRRPTAIKRIIDENSSQLRYLYNKRLRTGNKLSGRMEVEIRIAAAGNVKSAKVLRSDIGDGSFEKSITHRILTWRFRPVPDSLGELKVNYPFEFYEENSY